MGVGEENGTETETITTKKTESTQLTPKEGETTEKKVEDVKKVEADAGDKESQKTSESKVEDKKDDLAAEKEDSGAEKDDSGAETHKDLGPPNALEAQIIRQIEYYFGDMNLVKDKFMQTTIKESTDGWISVDVPMTFNRLKSLSTDAEVILNALKKSRNGLLEINKEEKKIRRVPSRPLPEKANVVWEEQNKRTLYLKGFPLDSTIDQILKYFDEYDNIENVFMRKQYNTKTFKGSVFLTFKAEDDLKEFMKKGDLKFGESSLTVELKTDYVVRKKKEQEERKKINEERKQAKRGKGPKDSKDDEPSDKKSKTDEFNPESIDKGCLLKITSIGPKVTWEEIKKTFKEHAEIAFVEFKMGDTEAIIRFHEKGSAELALTRAIDAAEDKKIKICDEEVNASVVDGEEEVAFWRSFWERKRNQPRRNHSSRGGKRGRGRGGYDRRGGRGGFNRKRGADEASSSEPKGKQAKHKHFDKDS